MVTTNMDHIFCDMTPEKVENQKGLRMCQEEEDSQVSEKEEEVMEMEDTKRRLDFQIWVF